MTVEEQIYLNSVSSPDKVALVSGDEAVSYRQMWERSLCCASVLRERYGLCVGDRVILSAGGNVGFVYAYLGVHLAGGICVPIDPDTNGTRFNHILSSTKPVLVVGSLYKVSRETVPYEDICRDGEPCADSFSSENITFPSLDRIADILFTTGTTGAPKGVALSYGNLKAAALNINTFIGNNEDDVELLALPVSHSFGLGRMRCVLSKGGTLVMLGTFANVKKFFSEMKRCSVTGFAMVPSSWAFIKKMSGKYIGRFADRLKYIEIGSSFMPIEDKRLLMELLPDTRICMHYGSTEASRSAFMEFHSSSDNLLTIGKASPNCDIRIMLPDGAEAPAGSEGELCVKGEHVTCSYWGEDAGRFASDFYGEYFRTGDCALKDEDGFIYLRSRIKEMINVGGKKVAPMEVEDIINAIQGVRESACVGIPDPDGVMGEVVKAFIVADDDVTDDYLIANLKPRLEVYKMPVAFVRIAEIPKTSSGKIQRLALKNL